MPSLSVHFVQELNVCTLLLLQYFPGQPHVRAFLKKVDDWLSSQNNEPIKGQDWLSQVDSLQVSGSAQLVYLVFHIYRILCFDTLLKIII